MKSLFWSALCYVCMFALTAFFHMTETAIFNTTNARIRSTNYSKRFIENTLYIKNSTRLMMTIVLLLELIVEYPSTLSMNNIINIISPNNTIGQLFLPVLFMIKTIILSVVFKTIALSYCESVAIYTSQLFLPFFITFKFLGNAIIIISEYLIKPFAFKYNSQNNFNNKIKEIIFIMQDNNIEKEIEEIAIAEYFLGLYQLQIKQIMIQISEFPCVELKDDYLINEEEVNEVIDDYAKDHDYVIMWQNDINNIIGVICIKDYLLLKQSSNGSIRSLLKDPKFILSSLPADRCLEWFKREDTEILCVVNDFGDFCGVITFDQITKEIFRYDKNKNIIPMEDGGVLILGNINIRNINRKMNWRIPYDYMSISGLVFHLMHCLPTQNQKIVVENYSINFKEVSNGRIQKVYISKLDDDFVKEDMIKISEDETHSQHEDDDN